MMDPLARKNPFDELYLSEAIEDPALYSRWFSPAILTGEAVGLFRKSNTVLRGSTGVGKTMLMRLLSPNVRMAYLSRPAAFNLPIELEPAIGINVNFTHAGFTALGGRSLRHSEASDLELWPLFFGDLLNCYMVVALIEALRFLKGDGRVVAEQMGARLDAERMDAFAQRLAGSPCWFGGLDDVDGIDGLTGTLRARIEQYWAFVNWNRRDLPASVGRSKTTVGAPLLAAREALTKTQIVDADVPVIVTLDQYEILYHIDYVRKGSGSAGLGQRFCRVVNSLLALRQPGVFFKIGVRHYAWGREPRTLHTDQQLERGRDYEVIDLDQVLRRHENSGDWVFPAFAADVAARRIAGTVGGESRQYGTWFKDKMETLTPDAEIEKYCRGDAERVQPDRPAGLTRRWEEYLADVYRKSKYVGRLADVWIRQAEKRGTGVPDVPPRIEEEEPWRRVWWEKERRAALLTQIASDCRQRKLYAGWDTMLTLSGANVLVFINLCREIWDHWERANVRAGKEVTQISPDLQSQAVRIVADAWLDKQRERPNGATRRDFVIRLGVGVRKALIDDRSLSYPGGTGFSVAEADWLKDSAVRTFLQQAVDHGALVDSVHTTKEKDGKPRRKWYLFPILCPNFEIPAIRTKEPRYVQVSTVRRWIVNRDRSIASDLSGRRPSGPSLFEM